MRAEPRSPRGFRPRRRSSSTRRTARGCTPGTSKSGPDLVLYFGGNAEEVSWMLESARAETAGHFLAADRLPRLRRERADRLPRRISFPMRFCGIEYATRELQRQARLRLRAQPRQRGGGGARRAARARGRDPVDALRQPRGGRAALLPLAAGEVAAAPPLRFDRPRAAARGAAAVPDRRARRSDSSRPRRAPVPGLGRAQAQAGVRRRAAQRHRRRRPSSGPRSGASSQAERASARRRIQ